MALASTGLLLTTSLGIWVPWVNVRVVGLSPWISWADTHSNFSRVVQVPRDLLARGPYSAASVEMLRWATVACALLFFAYFGFADETIKNSRGGWGIRRRVVGGLSSTGATSKYHLSSSHSSSRGASATLPVFIRKDTAQKRDSFDSFPICVDARRRRRTRADAGRRERDVEVNYSSSPSSASSASSDTESVGGEDGEIEVSSLHRASVHIPTTLTPLEPVHVQRPSADVPMPVVVRDAADIV
ncbi:hypothetical protein B0H13DRAFT_2358583 [Mycena leptocephala]|nr:hypothetical protein B0H13DRAFT_2358583 [Mycena leptocephala]